MPSFLIGANDNSQLLQFDGERRVFQRINTPAANFSGLMQNEISHIPQIGLGNGLVGDGFSIREL